MHNQAKVDRTLQFIQGLKHVKGEWHGRPFQLTDWQHKFINNVFGTVDQNNCRQYEMGYLEIPKKNGKSEFGAALALDMLCADDEMEAEVYSCAADKAQASIVFDSAASMVEQNPTLKKYIQIIPSRKRMVYWPTKSIYQVLSAEAYTKHGLNVSCCIFDELHAQPNRDLWDIMTQGAGDARRQPLWIVLTTAGKDPGRQSIGWEVHKKALDVLDGDNIDDTFYPLVYGLRETEDWENEENWKRANPSIGQTITMEKVRKWYKRAKGNPDLEFNFKQLRLNMWLEDVSTQWVPLTEWNKCNYPLDTHKLIGKKCWGGLDLSTIDDLTAFILIFPPQEGIDHYVILPFQWIPEDNMRLRSENDKVPYVNWWNEGYIYATPGNVIDYRFIVKTILEANELYDIQQIGFDDHNALQVSLELADHDITMVDVKQGFWLSPAMKEFAKLIKNGELNHMGNPVLKWQMKNIRVKTNDQEYIKPVKAKRKERIDGIVAAVMAIVRMMTREETVDYEGMVTSI